MNSFYLFLGIILFYYEEEVGYEQFSLKLKQFIKVS